MVQLAVPAPHVTALQAPPLYEAAMSRRLGVWTGGAEGRAQVAAADAWMTAQGIAEPERMTAMLLGWT